MASAVSRGRRRESGHSSWCQAPLEGRGTAQCSLPEFATGRQLAGRRLQALRAIISEAHPARESRERATPFRGPLRGVPPIGRMPACGTTPHGGTWSAAKLLPTRAGSPTARCGSTRRPTPRPNNKNVPRAGAAAAARRSFRVRPVPRSLTRRPPPAPPSSRPTAAGCAPAAAARRSFPTRRRGRVAMATFPPIVEIDREELCLPSASLDALQVALQAAAKQVAHSRHAAGKPTLGIPRCAAGSSSGSREVQNLPFKVQDKGRLTVQENGKGHLVQDTRFKF